MSPDNKIRPLLFKAFIIILLMMYSSGCVLIPFLFPSTLSSWKPPLYKGVFKGEPVVVKLRDKGEAATLRVLRRPTNIEKSGELKNNGFIPIPPDVNLGGKDVTPEERSRRVVEFYFKPDLFLLVNIDQEPIDPSVFEKSTIKFRGRAIFTDVGVFKSGLPKSWKGERIAEHTAIMILDPTVGDE